MLRDVLRALEGQQGGVVGAAGCSDEGLGQVRIARQVETGRALLDARAKSGDIAMRASGRCLTASRPIRRRVTASCTAAVTWRSGKSFSRRSTWMVRRRFRRRRALAAWEVPYWTVCCGVNPGPNSRISQLPLTFAAGWWYDSVRKVNRLRQFRPESRPNVGLGGCGDSARISPVNTWSTPQCGRGIHGTGGGIGDTAVAERHCGAGWARKANAGIRVNGAGSTGRVDGIGFWRGRVDRTGVA